jgi:hypothetical protein
MTLSFLDRNGFSKYKVKTKNNNTQSRIIGGLLVERKLKKIATMQE